MRNDLTLTLHQWLQQLNIPMSRRLLDEKLQSHTDYPSLACITDVLDDLGIENGVYVVDKAQWDELIFPFLAYINIDGGRFVQVTKEDGSAIAKGQKLEHWDGISVFAEKEENWWHKDNEDRLKKENFGNKAWIAVLILLPLLAWISSTSLHSLQGSALLLFTLSGMAVSVLIAQKELGINNDITDKICRVNQSGCDAVMKSKGSKLSSSFNWSDAGLIYFTGFFLLLSGAQVLLPAISVLALPFTLFSVYYQWKVVKKWCPLCLIVVAILWIQALLQLPAVADFSTAVFTVNNIAYSTSVFMAVATGWLGLVKPLLKKNKQLLTKQYSLQRFRNNPEIFGFLLKAQRKVPTQPFDRDLQLGNPASPVQLIVACNPYCGPCGRTHAVLEELVETKDIGLTIRFTARTEKLEENEITTITYLLRLLIQTDPQLKRKILHDWYETANLDEFAKKYPLALETDVSHEMILHEQWSDEARIAATPTIFINGYELPKEYKATDLMQLIKRQEEVSFLKADAMKM